MTINPNVTFIRSMYANPIAQAKLLSLINDGATGKLSELELTGRTRNPDFAEDCAEIILRHNFIRPLEIIPTQEDSYEIDFETELMRAKNLASSQFEKILPYMIDKLELSQNKLDAIIDTELLQFLPDIDEEIYLNQKSYRKTNKLSNGDRVLLSDIPVLHFLLNEIEQGFFHKGKTTLKETYQPVIDLGESSGEVRKMVSSVFEGHFYRESTRGGLRLVAQRLCQAAGCDAKKVFKKFEGKTPAEILAEANRRAQIAQGQPLKIINL